MITGPLKSQIDAIWDVFWSGGISNPMDVIEQMTYLLFLKRLDELQLTEEKKAHRTGKTIGKPVFKTAEKGVGGQLCRWS